MGIADWLRDVWATRPSRIEARTAELEASIAALSLDDAEARVVSALGALPEGNVWSEPVDPAALERLPPAARRIFTRFPRIEIGGAALGGASLTLHDAPPGRVVVGSDLEHATVLVATEEETTWVVEDAPEGEGEDRPEPYASVAHYLLVVLETTKPRWWAG